MPNEPKKTSETVTVPRIVLNNLITCGWRYYALQREPKSEQYITPLSLRELYDTLREADIARGDALRCECCGQAKWESGKPTSFDDFEAEHRDIEPKPPAWWAKLGRGWTK